MTFCHGANVDNWVHANRPELFQLIEFELQIKFQFKIDYHRQKAKLHSICGIANSSRLLLTFMSILFTKYELCRWVRVFVYVCAVWLSRRGKKTRTQWTLFVKELSKKNVKQQSWNMEPASTYPKMETSTICVGDLFDKAHNPNLGSLHFSPLHSTLSISSLCSELIVALFSCMNFQIEY